MANAERGYSCILAHMQEQSTTHASLVRVYSGTYDVLRREVRQLATQTEQTSTSRQLLSHDRKVTAGSLMHTGQVRAAETSWVMKADRTQGPRGKLPLIGHMSMCGLGHGVSVLAR